MLDITTYRMYQELAKSQLPGWRLYQRHALEFFTVSMLPQLRAMIDTMHEGRFDNFMIEMGGLTEADLTLFLDVCKDTVEFQIRHFPNFPPILPLNNLIATFSIYQKIKALNNNFQSLLEIGPGCGYMPFFLKKNDGELKNYTQIEAAESFYLLQHHVSAHLFGSLFDERVYPKDHALSGFYGAENFKKTSESAERLDVFEIDLPQRCKIAHHYPWWRIGELAKSNDQFEMVISNANLLEFTPVALKDYLTLIDAKLAPNGLFFVQCFGGGERGGPKGIPSALRTLYEFGFAPLYLSLVDEGLIKRSPRWKGYDNYLNIDPKDSRIATLSNAVFINRRHELHAKYYKRENFRDFFFAPLPNIRNAFFGDLDSKRLYSQPEIKDMLIKSYFSNYKKKDFQSFVNDMNSREFSMAQ